MTFPLCVTSPNSLMLTSMMVPLVMTPSWVNMGDWGFFLTPIIGKQNVALSSGWVTWAFLNLNPMGRINLSYLGGFLVKSSPTYVTLVTILFHAFFLLLPVRRTLKTSFSPTALTLGRGTVHFPYTHTHIIIPMLSIPKQATVTTYSLLFSLLFDHVAQHFCTRLALSGGI